MSGTITKPKAWVLATRPQTLPVAIAPVFVGSALAFADGKFSWLAFWAALTGAVCIQIGTNLFNDYADHQKGADTPDRLGPPRACANGWLSPKAVLAATYIIFAFAIVSGVVLVSIAGWPIVAIGLLSIACGLAYTGGPLPLAYLGIADLFVFVFFGLVAVCGTYFVHTGTVSVASIVLGSSLGAIATGLLVINNLRDRHTDKLADKRTLAVRFGAGFARRFYAGLVVGAFILLICYAAMTKNNTWLLGLGAAPLFGLLVRQAFVLDGRELNLVLKRTALGEFGFAVLLSIGILL